MHLIDINDCIDDAWPIVDRSDSVPKGMTNFYPTDADKHGDDYAHFFVEDYRFERIWTEPERYVPVLKKYAGMIMPDFSTYTNMPIPMQIWNAYRNKALAAYYQSQGIDVIPSLMWSDDRSFDWIFDGMPIGGTYALGATGFDADDTSRHGFYTGLFEAIRCLKPNTLLVYGRKLNLHLPCRMVYYSNNSIARLREVDARRAAAKAADAKAEDANADDVMRDCMGTVLGRILSYQDEYAEGER